MTTTFGAGATVLAGSLLAFAAMPAGGDTTSSSASTTDAPSIAVAYGDLDLESAHGAQLLYARIERAASQVCGSRYGKEFRGNLLGRTRANDRAHNCRMSTVANAVAQINRPMLTARHNAVRRPRRA